MAGRRPIDYQSLDRRDRQWFHAFHELRDGVVMPLRPLEHWFRHEAQAKRRISQLERMSLAEYWADFLSQEPSRSRPADWQPPRLAAVKGHVESMRRDEIEWLKLRSDPERIKAQSAGHRVWDALWRARTLPTLAEACKQWIGFHRDARWEPDRMPDVGTNVYPTKILDHAQQFIAMKRDRRFPKSEQADSSRIDYLARGMAGLEIGISPLTAIERLRNVVHGPGGPFWSGEHCRCWRCFLLKERDNFYERLGEVV